MVWDGLRWLLLVSRWCKKSFPLFSDGILVLIGFEDAESAKNSVLGWFGFALSISSDGAGLPLKSFWIVLALF